MHNNQVRSAGSLSEKQERLLSQFYDGECSYLAAFFARRLVSKNANARSFLADLGQIKKEYSHRAHSANTNSVDLWDRIDARIDQEQRAALYLGTRRLEQSGESLWRHVSLQHTLVGGLSGAAVAVVLLVAMTRPSKLMTFSAPGASPVAGPQLVQPVGIGGSVAPRNRYQVTSTRAHNPLEVDWMRANGSLKLIPDPSGSSAIIWVRRRPLPSSASATQKLAPRLHPTPLGLAAVSSGAQRHQLDEPLQPGAK